MDLSIITGGGIVLTLCVLAVATHKHNKAFELARAEDRRVREEFDRRYEAAQKARKESQGKPVVKRERPKPGSDANKPAVKVRQQDSSSTGGRSLERRRDDEGFNDLTSPSGLLNPFNPISPFNPINSFADTPRSESRCDSPSRDEAPSRSWSSDSCSSGSSYSSSSSDSGSSCSTSSSSCD